MKIFPFLFYLIISLSLILVNLNAQAHTVQVGYCDEGNGTITVWLEHWHSTVDPNTTYTTIDITVNGVTNSFSGAPSLSIQNTPKDSLPNCINMFNIMGACATQADTFNDWFGFQFTGLPSNVPITITVVAGGTVATEDACGMFPVSSNTIILTNVAENDELEDKITLLPNPSNGIFQLAIEPSISEILTIEVFDMIGNNIKSLATNTNATIDLSNSLKGMYFVKIISKNNKAIIKKIIII